MPSTRVLATVHEEILLEEDGEERYVELTIKAPVLLTRSEGQKGRFGVPLEPDTNEAVIDGDLTIVGPDAEEMTEDEFTEQYGEKAEDALDRVYEDKERLHEAASEEAHQQEMAHKQQKAEHKLAQRRGL